MPLDQVQVQGAATWGPPQPTTSPFPTISGTMDLTVTKTYQVTRSVPGQRINSPLAFVDLVQGSMSAVRFISLRVSSGTLIVRVSSAAGALQVFNLSDLWVQSCPNPGSEFTAIAVEGVADIELVMSGDP